MSNLQGITVAIGPSGIAYFNSIILGPAVTGKLAGMQPQNETINTGLITYQKYIAPSGNGKIWNPGQPFIGANNAVITLSGGQLHQFNPQIQSFQQVENGQFVLTLLAQNFSASFTWNEQYDWVRQGNFPSSKPYNTTFQNYTVGVGSMIVVMTFDFKYSNDSWILELVSATTTPQNITPNIPSNSVVQYNIGNCAQSVVPDACKKAIDDIDFSGAIMATLGTQFAAIPATGQINPDIRFQFEEGPGGLSFPGSAGIQAGVDGIASYKGTAFSAPDPPTLPLPAIPSDKHLAYNVSDYSFNSLMWAFFSAGKLKGYVTPGDLADPGVLNTGTYQDSSLQALYAAYPNLNMTVNIASKAAPTVTFASIFNLSTTAYAGLQSTLPADVFGKLKSIVNQAYLTETTFSTAVANAIGQEAANEYITPIEQAAKILAGVVVQNNEVVLNVVQDGKEIPVITFDVTQTDILQNLALGQSGAAQTLIFAFQIIPELTQTQFVSSTISGINSGDFSFMWKTALEQEYAGVMAVIGQSGVALPRIPNFNFLFDKALITINTGYVDVVTDVQHTSDVGATKYHASKR